MTIGCRVLVLQGRRRQGRKVCVHFRPRVIAEVYSGAGFSDTLYTLSLVSRRWRQAALLYLMRGILVEGDWVECDRALVRLSEMKIARHVRCASIVVLRILSSLTRIQSRRFTLLVTLTPSSLPRRPPPNMPSHLSTLLHSMTRAQHLGLSLPSYYSPLFSEQLRHTDHLDESLRRVRSVCIGAYCEWLAKLCANVEQVVAMQRPESGESGWLLDTKLNPAARMLQTMTGSSSLGVLELETEWSLVLVEGTRHFDDSSSRLEVLTPVCQVVRRSMPGLQEFGMLGDVPLGVRSQHESTAFSNFPDSSSSFDQAVLPTLGRLKRLAHLSFSDLRRLHVVLDKRKDMDAAHQVASMCAARIGTLQSITVGDEMFDVVRTARGKFVRTERSDL